MTLSVMGERHRRPARQSGRARQVISSVIRQRGQKAEDSCRRRRSGLPCPWEPQPGGFQDHASPPIWRSEEHTSELQSLMRISYAVFCLKKKKKHKSTKHTQLQNGED